MIFSDVIQDKYIFIKNKDFLFHPVYDLPDPLVYYTYMILKNLVIKWKILFLYPPFEVKNRNDYNKVLGGIPYTARGAQIPPIFFMLILG